MEELKEFEPCDHPGCLNHVTHPCEGCGRIGGRFMTEIIRPDEMYKEHVEKVNKRGKSFWGKMWLNLVCILFAILGFFVSDVVNQPHKNTDHLAKEVIINPEIKILTEYQKMRNSKIPAEIAEMQAISIIKVAKEFGYPVELLVGIIGSESNFDPFSVSGVGAAGLMQILIEDTVQIDDKKKFDIEYNLRKGCEILNRKLAKNNKELPKALVGYSGGAEGYVDKVYIGVGRYTMYRSKKMDSGIDIVRN